MVFVTARQPVVRPLERRVLGKTYPTPGCQSGAGFNTTHSGWAALTCERSVLYRVGGGRTKGHISLPSAGPVLDAVKNNDIAALRQLLRDEAVELILAAMRNDDGAALEQILRDETDLGQKNVMELILAAIENNDVAALRKLLQDGVDPNEPFGDGYTVLMLAATQGKVEVLQTLIEFGAQINTQSHVGITAMMRAAFGGHVEILRVLIELGAHINAQDNDGITAVMEAAAEGHVEALRVLIDAGSDLNLCDKYKRSTVRAAMQGKEMDSLQLLLDAGANPNMPDWRGHTPLMYAVIGSQEKALRLLIRAGADLNKQDPKGCTAVHYAALMDKIEALRTLIEAGAGLNIPSSVGTAIHCATNGNKVEAVRLLVEAKVDVRTPVPGSQLTPLYVAERARGYMDMPWLAPVAIDGHPIDPEIIQLIETAGKNQPSHSTPVVQTRTDVTASPAIMQIPEIAEGDPLFPDTPMSRAEMYDFLLMHYGLQCQGCGRLFDDVRYLELDHKTPRSDGGSDHISNRILLCGPCNRAKGNQYTLSGLRRLNKKNGWMVRDLGKKFSK